MTGVGQGLCVVVWIHEVVLVKKLELAVVAIVLVLVKDEFDSWHVAHTCGCTGASPHDLLFLRCSLSSNLIINICARRLTLKVKEVPLEVLEQTLVDVHPLARHIDGCIVLTVHTRNDRRKADVDIAY